MSEQLICPRCGTPNAPTATSCYYCGWAPSVGQENAGAPAGPAAPQAGGTGAAAGGNGPTYAGGYAAGQAGNGGGYDEGSYGGYGTGAYGVPDQGAASAGYAGAGYGSGYPGGPGSTQLRGNAGGQPPSNGAAATAAAENPDRNKLLMIGAGVIGGLVVIALIVFVIVRFVVPGDGPVAGPGPAPSSQNQPTGGSTSTAPSASTSPGASRSKTPVAPPDYGKIASKVNSGVFKVYATACGSDGTRIGSAFLIDHDTAVASYASLAGAQVIAVDTGSGLVSAEVSSADPDHGIVILKLNRSVGGHVFDIDTSTMKADDPVGLLGFTEKSSNPKVRTSRITEADQTARVGDTKITGLSGTSLEANDGWAGAPTLNADGDANGVVIAGPGATQAMIVPGKAVKRAEGNGQSLPGGTCNDPHGPEITTIGGSPTRAVKKTLQTYFEGINTGDYRTAYEQLGPHSNSGPFSGYVNGWRSAYDFNIDVKSVSGSGDGTHAQVSFNSITLPGQGPKGHAQATCARWDMNYTFAADGNRLLIDRVTATPSLC